MGKRRSIRRQFTITFIAVVAGTIALCILANLLLLRPYYMAMKQSAVRDAYRSVNEAVVKGEIASSEFDVKLSQIGAKYDIRLLVLDAESQTIKASMEDNGRMARLLWNNILGIREPGTHIEIIEKTSNYTLQIESYEKTSTEYLTCWGYLDNGNMFLIESAVDSVNESALISIRFLIVAGLIAMALGVLFILILAKRMTRPITDLTALSEDMKSLHFDAKYEGDAGNELDLLGENMNELSATLETTISDLKTANNELLRDIARKEEIDEERREFLSNVSHELKTPIALIQGYAEGLAEGIIDDEESRREYCRVIMDEAGKMNRMIRQLLTLSHLESGEDKVSFARFDIVELIRNYLRSARLLIEKAGCNVRMEEYPPCEVWADEFLVEEVLQNYVTNALHHLDGERVMEIRITKREERVRVSVFNTGEPIPEESIGHIWEKFYKVDKARTREYGGSGIGLSIVRAIMESMHRDYGVINYDNGVEFWFEL
ncbi:MAG: two-component sensor histidine kinase [Lachnospiraceae bacterium]|nr:two-component sensor histidine kinase [Lachnospiraceae bacterium]